MGGYDLTFNPMHSNDVWYSAPGGYSLLEIVITISWRTRDGRIFGEDTNLNGALDAGEDKNSNGRYDSPVQLRLLLSDRNTPLNRTFLGRP